jgi:hypothetical protein
LRLGRLTPPAAKTATTPGKTYRNAEWVLLRAARTLPAEERPSGYVLDLVSGAKEPTVGLVKNHGHAWIRLIEPDGRLYSVGFYPDESTGLAPERWPGLTFPGMLLNPDKWDRAGWHETVTRYDISREQFEMVGAHLERLQRDRTKGSLPFRLLDLNCVWLVVEVAALIGVEVDVEYSLAHHLLRNLAKRLQFLGAWRGQRRPTRLIANVVAAVAGGRHTFSAQWVRSDNDEVSRRDAHFEPMQASVRDAFTHPVPFNHVIAFQRWQLTQPNSHPASHSRPASNSNPNPNPARSTAGPDRAPRKLRTATATDGNAETGPPDRAEHNAPESDGDVDQRRAVDQ